jgi:uncharacterized integral membrane protein
MTGAEFGLLICVIVIGAELLSVRRRLKKIENGEV